MDCMTPNRTPYSEPLSPQDTMSVSMCSQSPSRPRSPGRRSPRASIGLKTREAPSSAFYNPDSWRKEYATISREIVRTGENVRLFRDADTELLLKHERRAACCVRTLPSLDTIKEELKNVSLNNRAQMYDILENCPSEVRGSPMYAADAAGGSGRRSTTLKKQRRSRSRRSPSPANPEAPPAANSNNTPTNAMCLSMKSYLPNPSIWAVGGINQNEITVYDSVTGKRMLRIRDPKMNVPVMTLRHAPFRGFMDRHADVIPISKPADILRLKSSQLVETDYVWVGFADGTIRLFPANVGRIRESDRAFQLSKGDLPDLVFELPKYHAAAILSIVRSPCHQEEEGFNAATANRLSSAVEYMSASSMIREGQDREHLSLMCTASVDSSIAIWDVRKIYQTLEKMRQQRREALLSPSGGTLHAATGHSNMNNDIITMDGFNPLFSVRSACILIKARPLMKLKGGVVGMRTLQWVSTLVATEGYQPPREVTELTRDAEEQSAPQLVKERQPVQVATRFERREENRRSLRLSEHDMRDVEKQLEEMLPPLAEEPPQSMRINLIVAGDGAGTVHFWNLDDELRRKLNTTTLHIADTSDMDGLSTPSRSPARSSYTSYSDARSVSSPSVQLSAVECAVPVQRLMQKTKRKAKSSRRSSQPSGRPSTTGHRGSIQLTDTSMHPSTTSSPNKSRMSQQLSSSVNRSSNNTSAHDGASSPVGYSKLQLLSMDRKSSYEYHHLSVVDTNVIMELQESPTHQRRSMVLKDANSPPKSAKKKTPARRAPALTKAKGGGKASATITSSAAAAKDDPLRLSTGTAAGSTAFHDDDEEEKGRYSGGSGAMNAQKKTTKKSTSVSPSRAKTPTKATTPAKSGTQKTVRKSTAKKQTSPSRSRPSTASPGRPSTSSPARLSTQDVTPRASTSPSRNLSPSHARTDDRSTEYLPRTAMCRLEFTGGVAVTGMAIDVPPKVITTLRRIPNPEDKPRSVLEEPTPEEVERRVLENSFEMLTEEKALYFVMQYFQMYVAVEGAVLNVRFLPEWTAQDDDGRELFKTRPQRHQSTSLIKPRFTEREQAVDGKVDFATFEIRFTKLILDAHSQPVTQLYLDIRQRLVWVARNDGLLSLFSTDSKQIVTQVAHPCAEAAKGAPHYSDWWKQQVDFLTMVNDKSRENVLHLEWHPETLGFPPGHFFAFVPYLKKSYTTLLLATVPANAPMRESSYSYEDALFLNFGSLASSYNTSVWTVDTRCRNVEVQRNRETCLSQLIEQLRWSRGSADLIRRTQKEFYEATCDRIVKNVFSVMKELGSYNQLPILYKFMRMWQQRVLTFPRQHVMRQLRSKRLQRAVAVANALQRATQQKLRSLYYVRWVRAAAQKRIRQKEELPQRLLSAMTVSATRKLPTPAMMERLAQHYTRVNVFRGWQQWCRSVVSPSISVMRSMDRSVERSVSRAGSPLVRTNTFRFRAYNSMKGSLGHTRQSSPAGAMNNNNSNVGPANNFSSTQMGLDVAPTSRLAVLERVLHSLWLTRPYIMRFRESRSTDSVLDESWLSLVESSEASAATDDDLGRRLAVLRYGLLPLLQGLLATADDVLPTLNDPKVCDEVISMLTGIQLCLDYMVADAESFLTSQHVALQMDNIVVSLPPTRQSGRLSGSMRPSGEMRPSGLRGGPSCIVAPAGQAFPEEAAKRVLEVLIPLALDGDQDSQEAVDEIVAATESFEAFLLFVGDEQVINRRREASAGVI